MREGRGKEEMGRFLLECLCHAKRVKNRNTFFLVCVSDSIFTLISVQICLRDVYRCLNKEGIFVSV